MAVAAITAPESIRENQSSENRGEGSRRPRLRVVPQVKIPVRKKMVKNSARRTP
jgi:hypothetical protein